MIELNTLAKSIENGLNALSTLNSMGIVFKIHSDAGSWKRAVKTRTGKQLYTNGLLQVTSSSIVPVQNLVVATRSAHLTVTVQLFNEKTDEAVIEAHRALLDGYFKSTSVQMLEGKDGKQYSVSSTYSLASTGSVTNPPPLGTNLTFEVYIDYGMVQNGINSSEFHVSLDGVAVQYTSFTIDRSCVMDSAPYSNTDGSGRNVATSNALTFAMEIPATDTDDASNTALRTFLLDGDMKTVHTLTVVMGTVQRSYSVVFGQNTISINGVQNAGYSVKFIEAADLGDEENAEK